MTMIREKFDLPARTCPEVAHVDTPTCAVCSLSHSSRSCGLRDREDPVEEGGAPATLTQAIDDERPPPNGANGTRPSCFWATGSQQALRTLGGQALNQGGGLLRNIPLSQVSGGCREVLRSAVECALTQD